MVQKYQLVPLFMQKIQRIIQFIWGALLAVALYGFYQCPHAVAWLLATLSSSTPLVISLLLNDDQWDRTFFAIVVFSLSIVAIAVSFGQWAVVGTSPAWIALIPLSSLILWIIHERKSASRRL